MTDALTSHHPYRLVRGRGHYRLVRGRGHFISTVLAVVCASAIPFAALGATIQASRSLTLIATQVISGPDTALRVEKADGRMALLRFETQSLPRGDTITSATLRLKWNTSAVDANRNPQTIRVMVLKSDNWDEQGLDGLDGKVGKDSSSNLFGAISLLSPEKNSAGVGAVTWNPVPRRAQTLTDGGDSRIRISLLLLPGQDDGKRAWYSISAADPANRPRLIISYTVPGEKAKSVAQSDGLPAVQSPSAFLPGKNPSAQAAYHVKSVTTNSSAAPVFFRDRIYILTKENRLQVLSPLGSAVGDPVGPALAGTAYHLSVSQSGRLFIVGNRRVLAYRIDDQNNLIKAGDTMVATPAAAPAVGPEGNFYFVHAGTLADEVWGLNPDLQELWKVTIGATKETVKASRLTVGPSGAFVYLVTQNEGLVAINTQTGEYSTKPLPAMETPLKEAGSPLLRAPVVISSGKNDMIYVAASAADSGVLATIAKGLTTDTLPPQWHSAAYGLFSQPLLDTRAFKQHKQIYSVHVQTTGSKLTAHLVAIDAANLTVGIPGAPLHVPAGSDNPYLFTRGNLVGDTSGNVFVYNGDDQRLRAYSGTLSPIADATLDSLLDPRLMFGQDGTLYANNSDNKLFAIIPQYTLGAPGIADTISSPTHLFIKGELRAGKHASLRANGSVLFAKGFKVKEGATLACCREKTPKGN
jgi:hypothetical protein